MKLSKTQKLYNAAKKVIPGGTQLLSKRPEQFLPGRWPAYYKKARGYHVWDLDGNKYADMSYMGIGSCVLGYADPDVNRAVTRVVSAGSMTTLNAPEEVYLAQLLIKLHPWADMARYARSGGEAMAQAVRIARASTRKDIVLFCGYHGWHDWYLASNLADDTALDGHLLPGLNPLGVPRSLTGTSLPFHFNDIAGFEKLVSKHRGKIAAVVMEPIRNIPPERSFISAIRHAVTREKAVLVIDEITAGFRLNCGGAHLTLGIEPDIAVFAKGVSNGYPMAVILGKKDRMTCFQDTFISSTYWTERIGPAAAIATIEKYKARQVHTHLKKLGMRVQSGWLACAQKHAVPVHVGGMYPLGHFSFDHPSKLALKTLFTQEMLAQGFLATTAFYASLAHSDAAVARYLSAADTAFACIARAIRSGAVESFLRGPVCHAGFKRLT